MTPLINKNVFNIYIYEKDNEYHIELKKNQISKFMNNRVNHSDVFKYKKLLNFDSYFVVSNELLGVFNDYNTRYSVRYDLCVNKEDNSFQAKKGTYILTLEKDEKNEIFINHFIDRIKKYDELLTPNTKLNFQTKNSIFSLLKSDNDNNYKINDKSHAILVTKDDAFIVLNCIEKINKDDTINATLSARKLTLDEYKEFIKEISKKNIYNDYYRLFQNNSIVYTTHFVYPEIINTDDYNLADSWESINQFFLLKKELEKKLNHNTSTNLKI